MSDVSISTFASSTLISEKNKVDKTRSLKDRENKIDTLMTTLLYAFVCFIIYAGWCFEKYELVTAERGTGYYFGIIGTVLMLLLVVYPLRKRIHSLAFLGGNKLWFRLHIAFGIVGPVFILFHANFNLGSLNSQVAFFSMTIVALSGIVGRYIYLKFHHGLSGQLVSLSKLIEDFEQEEKELNINQLLTDLPDAKKELFGFAEKILTPPGSLILSIERIITAGWQAQFIKWKMKRIATTYLGNLPSGNSLTLAQRIRIQRELKKEICLLLKLAFRVTKYNFYERSFALWHVLHIPLVILMVLAVVVHIVAVHLY
jgi:hypothetical protein